MADLPPGLFTSPANPDFGPGLYQGGNQPAALTPPHRLAAGTPYLIGVSAVASTANPVPVPVTTATTLGDTVLILTAGTTTAAGAPVVTGVSDTKLNGYLQGSKFAPGVKTALGLPADLHSCASSTALTLADTISVALAGNLNGNSVIAVGIPQASHGGIDQQAVAAQGGVTTNSATAPITAWPGEQAVALFVNTNAAGAPTSIGGFTQLAQLHAAATIYATAGYLFVPNAQAVTASFTVGASSNMTALVVTVPGFAAADPSAFDSSTLVPPGWFASPGGLPHPAPPQQAAQPPPLPPLPSPLPVHAQRSPPGLFLSPAALPFIPPVPQQAAQPGPLTPPGIQAGNWDPSLGVPPGLFLSPGGRFLDPVPHQFAEPLPLPGAEQGNWDPSLAVPPGMFLSPAGQPHPAPPQQFAQPQPLPPTPHPAPVFTQSIAPGLFISPASLPFLPPIPQQVQPPLPHPPGVVTIAPAGASAVTATIANPNPAAVAIAPAGPGAVRVTIT